MLMIENFFHEGTSTHSYLVYDSDSKDAVFIDPVLDFDYTSGEIRFKSIESYARFINEKKLSLLGIIDTHVHADHLTGSHYLKEKFPQAKVVINHKIVRVQEIFNEIFQLPNFLCDGSQFDQLIKDGETIQFGTLEFKVIATPGHTPACTCFLIQGHLFVGDTIFMEDQGSGRCDFPDGSAEALYDSIKNKLYTLPDETKVYVGHDYCPGGRELKFKTTIKTQKEQNIHLNADTSKENFVELRTKRDATLNNPTLLFPSIQFNMNAGRFPFNDNDNDKLYFKIPLQLPQGE